MLFEREEEETRDYREGWTIKGTACSWIGPELIPAITWWLTIVYTPVCGLITFSGLQRHCMRLVNRHADKNTHKHKIKLKWKSTNI